MYGDRCIAYLIRWSVHHLRQNKPNTVMIMVWTKDFTMALWNFNKAGRQNLGSLLTANITL
jgi:hypothetical protein